MSEYIKTVYSLTALINDDFVIDDIHFSYEESDIFIIFEVLCEDKSILSKIHNYIVGGAKKSLAYKDEKTLIIGLNNQKTHVFVYRKNNNYIVTKITDDKLSNTRIQDYPPKSDFILSDKTRKEYSDKLERYKLNGDIELTNTYKNEEHNDWDYNKWTDSLNNKQKAFLEKEESSIIKGPAGTGKTLTLMLKAIKMAKAGHKVLFTCHSETVTEYVRSFFTTHGIEIDVLTLFFLAQNFIFAQDQSLMVLGNDNYEGKKAQIEILTKIVEDYKKTEHWQKRKEVCNFNERNFIWDLIREIANVIDASGIKKGDIDKYKRIVRNKDMMQLNNDAEKEVVFEIYKIFINYLYENGNKTSDMLINDFIRFLTTNDWDYKKKKEGYDCIFVDEMQLFDDQEKLALTYLSRNDGYPLFFMATDENQAIDEVYSGFGFSGKFNSKGDIEENAKVFNFTKTYRFTDEIFTFLHHIKKTFPQMNLSLEEANGKHGDIPTLYYSENEVECAIDNAKKFSGRNLSVAILALNDNLFDELLKATEVGNYAQFKSKSDAGSFQYLRKKKIIISVPTYVIGLQFDVVILAGCARSSLGDDTQSSRDLRDIYLGASRAKDYLLLIAKAEQNYSVPNFLQKALENKCLNMGE